MLKKLMAAAVVVPLATTVAVAEGGCNWGKKQETVAQSTATPAPASAQTAASDQKLEAAPIKLDVAAAPAATPETPKTN